MQPASVSRETAERPSPDWSRDTHVADERYTLLLDDRITCHTTLDREDGQPDLYLWEWIYCHQPAVAYTRARGTAPDLATAQLAAERFRPDVLALDIGGRLAEWWGCPQQYRRQPAAPVWTAWIGDSLATVQDSAGPYFPKTPWTWSRDLAPADEALVPVLELCGRSQCEGRAATRHAAMVAAATAPERLRHACAIAGSTLYAPRAALSDQYREGFRAMRSGAATPQCPYDHRDPDWDEWMDGWHDASVSRHAPADLWP